VWRGRGGNQQVGRIVSLADSTVFDSEPRAAQRVDHLGYRTEVKAVPGERHPGHRIWVSHSDDDPTRASGHASELGERRLQLGDEVDGIDGKDAVQCAIGEGQLPQRIAAEIPGFEAVTGLGTREDPC
jgi:hypothetical protein